MAANHRNWPQKTALIDSAQAIFDHLVSPDLTNLTIWSNHTPWQSRRMR